MNCICLWQLVLNMIAVHTTIYGKQLSTYKHSLLLQLCHACTSLLHVPAVLLHLQRQLSSTLLELQQQQQVQQTSGNSSRRRSSSRVSSRYNSTKTLFLSVAAQDASKSHTAQLLQQQQLR
jgi:hypothetical protein